MTVSSKTKHRLRAATHACPLCGRTKPEVHKESPQRSGKLFTIDHRYPLALGGTDDLWNLWAVCWKCNQTKAHALTEHVLEVI